tara:strand:+ start:781 stop:2349 length:1569 start_codon:yes stop_codon:yes gene_type:complete
MSKLLTNQISNYQDNGPVEAKEGLNFANGKPLQIAGASGTSGQYLKSTGSSIAWTDFPSIPSAQVNTDWNATSGVAQILNKPNLATVATTGSYTDLLNQPTIPAAQVNSDWNASSGVAQILNKPTIFSGNYSDLSGKPSIPATITDLADVNLSNPIPDGSYLRWDTSTNRWISGTSSTGLNNIVEDLSPQLGASLDLNGHDITGGASSTIEVSGDTSKIKFLYNALTDLPSASDWHGMFAHVHTEGHGFFAHAGAWTQLLDVGSNLSELANVTSTAPNTNDVLTWNGSNWSPSAPTSGGATVTTDDSAPASPSDGDLWWKSDEGRLKVYYQDTNTSQWVDANPPLGNIEMISSGTNSVQIQTTSNASQDAVELWGGNAKRWRMTQNGGLLPNADDSYDIGSSSYKVRDLYLGSTSLHIGSVNIAESGGKLVLPAVEMTGHIIPDSNASYDLGNAEYKIRHLFLSDNTLYYEGDFLKVAQHNSGGSAQASSYLIPLAKLKDALNASADYESFKAAILAITDAT